jgi:hypothetical protein
MKQIESAVWEAVRPIARRYYRYVERADLEQECRLWMLAHPETTVRLMQNQGYLVRRLRTVVERYARRQKAAMTGYSVDDECFYSLAHLERLLPDAFDSEAVPPGHAMQDQGARSQEAWQEWETEVADVRRGLKLIPLHHYSALLHAYFLGNSVEVGYVHSAIRALQRVLGGARPIETGET